LLTGVTLVTYLVDTGSQVNVLDESTYRRLMVMPELLPCERTFYGYSAEKRSPC